MHLHVQNNIAYTSNVPFIGQKYYSPLDISLPFPWTHYHYSYLELFFSELRMVQPGRLVSNALKYAWRKRRVQGYESGNLGHIASVVTSHRVYNLEFCVYSDLKAFYDMVEAVFAVKLLTV